MKIILREQYLNMYHHVVCNLASPSFPASKCKGCIRYFRMFPRDSKLQKFKFSSTNAPISFRDDAQTQVKLI